MIERVKSCNLCCTKIENFSVSRGNNEIITDVNLHIHCGELTAIIGPNGAGKSTLFKAILGEIPHKGRLLFHDEKETHINHPLIGYVPQQLDFDKTTPASVLDLFAACRSNRPVWLFHTAKFRKRVIDNLKSFGVEYTIDRRLGALSGGEMQRVLLALALDPIPDILLLDEPVSGVDVSGMEVFYHTVSELRKKYDMTIIIISHDLPFVAKYADRIVYINKKVICAGTPQEVFENACFVKDFGRISYQSGKGACSS